MNQTTNPAAPHAPASKDEAQDRNCLRCRKTFWSEWYGERICARCKNTSVWRGAMFGSGGQGRRNGGGRPT
jgi:hypothetical protein